jgi:hypothetical protein
LETFYFTEVKAVKFGSLLAFSTSGEVRPSMEFIATMEARRH